MMACASCQSKHLQRVEQHTRLALIHHMELPQNHCFPAAVSGTLGFTHAALLAELLKMVMCAARGAMENSHGPTVVAHRVGIVWGIVATGGGGGGVGRGGAGGEEKQQQQ